MDYKVIIILIVLLFLVVLVYREISSLKDIVNKNIDDSFNVPHEKLMYTIQNNLDKYIGQIKNISNDNLQQLKKITLLNHQPIIKHFGNNYTETDNNSEFRKDIDYLSNGNSNNWKKKLEEKNKKIFEKKEQSHECYMSEETKKKDDMAEKNNLTYEEADDDNNSINISASSSIENDNIDIPLYDPNNIQNTIVEEENLETPRVSNLSKSMQTIDTGMIDHDDYNSDEDDNILLSVQPIKYKQFKDEIEVDILEVVSGNNIYVMDNEKKNDYNQINRNIEEVKEESGSNIISHDSLDVEKHCEDMPLQNKHDIKINEINNQIILNDNDSIANNSIGTNKSRSRKRNKKNIETSIETIEYLKPLDEYNFMDLRQLARQFNVPTTYKEMNKIKQYKKEELYNQIITFVNSKNKI